MRREPVDVAGLLATGRLVPQAPDLVALTDSVDAADRDVIASDANLALFSPWAEAMLYEAGLRAARVMVQAAGYRIDAGQGAHVTAIDGADAITSRAHHPVFVRLHRMRRRRHDFMYETAADPTERDLAQARVDVSTLIGLARHAIEALAK